MSQSKHLNYRLSRSRHIVPMIMPAPEHHSMKIPTSTIPVIPVTLYQFIKTQSMKTSVSQPIYQEAMAINRTIQQLTRGYHSNGTFNLAFKIKDDILDICNNLDQGVAARFEHTFEEYYRKAIKVVELLLEHMRIANASRMIRGGFPQELFDRVQLLKLKLILLLEMYRSDMVLDYVTLSNWARQKLSQA